MFRAGLLNRKATTCTIFTRESKDHSLLLELLDPVMSGFRKEIDKDMGELKLSWPVSNVLLLTLKSLSRIS